MKHIALELISDAAFVVVEICLETRQIAIEIFCGILNAIITAIYEK